MKFLWRLLGLVSRFDFETQQKEQTQAIELKIEASEKRLKEFLTESHASILRNMTHLKQLQNDNMDKLEKRLTALETKMVQDRLQLVEKMKEQEQILKQMGMKLLQESEGVLTRTVSLEMKNSYVELLAQLKQFQTQIESAQKEIAASVNTGAKVQIKNTEYLGEQLKDLQGNVQTMQEMVKITWINDVISDMEEVYGLDKITKR